VLSRLTARQVLYEQRIQGFDVTGWSVCSLTGSRGQADNSTTSANQTAHGISSRKRPLFGGADGANS
jgi:hypothetical protein